MDVIIIVLISKIGSFIALLVTIIKKIFVIFFVNRPVTSRLSYTFSCNIKGEDLSQPLNIEIYEKRIEYPYLYPLSKGPTLQKLSDLLEC